MSEALIPYQQGLTETREESLSRLFYQWEQRGRGWQVCDYPVELEPPLVTFYYFLPPKAPIFDDGRRETFLSGLLKGSTRKQRKRVHDEYLRQLSEYEEALANSVEPDLYSYEGSGFIEYRIILPKDTVISKAASINLIGSFSYASGPVSFELVGSHREIVFQIAALEDDAQMVRQQITSHLPGCVIQETQDHLSYTWEDGGRSAQVVDFGLSKEFMLPLNTAVVADSDPLITIIGAMSELEPSEVGVCQILFRKTRNNWAEAMLDSIGHYQQTPLFANFPELIPMTKQKIAEPLYAVSIRVGAKSPYRDRTWQIVRGIGAGLANLSSALGNELIPLSNDNYDNDQHETGFVHRFSFRTGAILNASELVSIARAPSSNIRTSRLIRETENTKSAPSIALHHQLVLGDNHHLGEITEASLNSEQRTRHLHIIGGSGSGKSTLMLNLIKQDLENGEGICVIDPHGDLIDTVLENVPEERLGDVILFDPADTEFPVGFNILQANSELEKNLLSSDLVATFRRMSTSWGDVMDSVLANTILAFVESSRGGTLFDLKRFLIEKDFRAEFLKTINDDAVRYFWENEFPNLTGKPQSSILVRLDAFLRNKIVRNIVCQKETKLNFREIMDSKKVLLIKLSQGLIGEENSYLFGTFIVSKINQIALSRQDSSDRPYFWIYMDEFHNFITPTLENILSGIRKYKIGLHLANQEYRQIQSRSSDVASSVMANCYTRICFRLGDQDAERFASGFSYFDAKALQNLGVGEAIARVERAEIRLQPQNRSRRAG